MFGKSVRLFKILGFSVKIDATWLILAVLITWSLAKGVFPEYYEDFQASTYWWMGVAGAIGLLLSIVFHELAHSIVARKYGIPIKGITLFIFGGVAQMDKEAEFPKSELYMAIAGPISSIILSIIFYALRFIGAKNMWAEPVLGVFAYLGFLNLVLAGFNLLPAFPLDGGRVLRSLLWKWKNDIRWATRISSSIGSGFGMVLIFLGAMFFFAGNFIGGVWWFLIGLFLRNASQMSYQQLMLRKALEGEPVVNYMRKDPITVDKDTNLRDFADNYIYKYHFKTFPVVEDKKLLGCVVLQKLKSYPPDDWKHRTVADVMDACSNENTIQKDEDTVKALSKMNQTKNSRIMVVDGLNNLVGILALKDLLEFLSLKVELGDVQ